MKAKDDRKKDPGGYKVYRKIEKNIWKDRKTSKLHYTFKAYFLSILTRTENVRITQILYFAYLLTVFGAGPR